MTTARGATLQALVLGLASLSGCGVLALTHDKMLGPVSPAGRIHSVVVSNDYIVTERGLVGVGDERDQPLFRPIPPGFPRRYAEPASMVKGLRGAMAFLRGLSFVVWGRTHTGRVLPEDALTVLRKGITAAEVLAALGTPSLWLRRKGGSLMGYRAEVGTFLSVSLGLPPLADQFVPIPGLGNIRIRWHYNIIKPYKTLLVFDAQERLVAWFRNDPDASERRLEQEATR
ncbi:MAG: hypothetical protein D6731_16180 [Planctomycetota bacterium]|nr:MAG: hypothetical protein D6731_16180 [Planctomycetota bacterium]